jgi:MFS family permease
MAIVGWTSISFMATANSTLQLESDPAMRGRVIALWAVAFMGTTALGGPFIGWVVSETNGRIGLGVGAIACFAAAAFGALARRHERVRQR